MAAANSQKASTPPPTQEVISLITPCGNMLEVTFDMTRRPALSFAVWSPTAKKDMVCKGVRDDGVRLVPPADPNGLIAKNVVLLASCVADYGTQENLVDDIRAFIRRYADVPDFWQELIAHYVLMTWVYDKFTAVPYLRFLGEPQSGKTRCLQTAGHLTYKAICASGATTASPLFRLLDVYRGTFVLDEADFKVSDLWSEIVKILNAGYMRGLPILRSDKHGDNYEPRAFYVFGPKILSTRKEFDDQALTTRCLTLLTEEHKIRADIPRQLPDAFYAEALALRNKLLRWRFDNFNRIDADESKLLNLEPRLTQIGTPLYSVATDAGFRARLLKFLGEQADDQRFERPQAVIVDALRHLVQGGQRNLPTMLGVKDVANEAEARRDGIPTEFTAKHTGSLLRGLGFHPERTRRGFEFELTESKLKELDERYPAAP